MHLHSVCSFTLLALTAGTALAGDPELPFDFSDAFYIENGLDPAAVIGRPDGTGTNSVIDDRENGPDLNNVRMLQMVAAYDHSGHPIFFYVPGILFENAFLDNAAGEEAREIADAYKVYEFPTQDAPFGSVFPKRQDLVADLRDGYFSNDPLGLWQVNICNYTDAAFNTAAGQEALAELASKNGLDLDGTPIVREVNEVEDLVDDGFMEIYTPPADGSGGLRWFLCPVVEDPRDGAIAMDAHLDVTEGIDAAQEFIDAFHCLRTTGDWCDGSACLGDMTGDGQVNAFDVLNYVGMYSEGLLTADITYDGELNAFDILEFIRLYSSGCN